MAGYSSNLDYADYPYYASIPDISYYEDLNDDAYHRGSHRRYQYVNSEKDFTLPLQKHKNVPTPYESPDEEISIQKYVYNCIGVASLLTENLLSHPFVVLRRQCQVHHNSKKFHLTPFTLVKPIIRLHRRQGVTTLWKGLGSCLLIRGMSLSMEDVLSKFTPWPKKLTQHTTMKQLGQHLLLKSISYAVVMPFYAASLVETVQSDIASEKPGIFDVFREGASRMLVNVPQKGRMIPIWVLIGPSVGLGLTKYLCGVVVQYVSTKVLSTRLQNKYNQRGAKSRDVESEDQTIDVYSNLISIIVSETIFYPFETILHRMQLQGTRTIIDDLDSGYSVVPILTNYEGVKDCYKSIIASEGYCGLYKGFGAMILQFASHIAVIKLTKWIFCQIAEICSTKPSNNVKEFYQKRNEMNLNHTTSSTTISRSISSNLSEF